MKLIIARLLYNFDFELQPEGEKFIEKQKVFGLWEKEPLPVRMILKRQPAVPESSRASNAFG